MKPAPYGLTHSIAHTAMQAVEGLRRGTYVLTLRLPRAILLAVGMTGTHLLDRGWYAYVGSALGAGGLRARLGHHIGASSPPHWHIDYLRRAADLRAVWFLESDLRREHPWAEILRDMSGAAPPIAKFGSSDCDCAGHLFYFRKRPSLVEFQLCARARCPNDDPVRSIRFDGALRRPCAEP